MKTKIIFTFGFAMTLSNFAFAKGGFCISGYQPTSAAELGLENVIEPPARYSPITITQESGKLGTVAMSPVGLLQPLAEVDQAVDQLLTETKSFPQMIQSATNFAAKLTGTALYAVKQAESIVEYGICGNKNNKTLTLNYIQLGQKMLQLQMLGNLADKYFHAGNPGSMTGAAGYPLRHINAKAIDRELQIRQQIGLLRVNEYYFVVMKGFELSLRAASQHTQADINQVREFRNRLIQTFTELNQFFNQNTEIKLDSYSGELATEIRLAQQASGNILQHLNSLQ